MASNFLSQQLRKEIRTINDKQKEMQEKMNKDIGAITGLLQQIASNKGIENYSRVYGCVGVYVCKCECDQQ